MIREIAEDLAILVALTLAVSTIMTILVLVAR